MWRALTEPDTIAKYFFGSRVQTDWQAGSPIVWKGEFDGKPYEDKGEIVEVEQNRLLRMTHFSPSTGRPDEPENYHTLTYRARRTWRHDTRVADSGQQRKRSRGPTRNRELGHDARPA